MIIGSLNKSIEPLSPDKQRAIATLRAEAEREKATLEGSLPALAADVVAAREAQRVAVLARPLAKSAAGLSYSDADRDARVAATRPALEAKYAVGRAVNAEQAAKMRQKQLAIILRGLDAGNADAGRAVGVLFGGSKGAVVALGGQVLRGSEVDQVAAAKVHADAAETANANWGSRTVSWVSGRERRAAREREEQIQREAAHQAAVDAARRNVTRAPKTGATPDAA